MHEMSIAQNIVQIALEHTQAGERIEQVVISVGELSGIEIDALQFGFSAVTNNTAAQGAILTIETVPGSIFCMNCLAQFDYHSRTDPCPKCRQHQYVVIEGNEMKVKHIEVN
ncbi:putative NiFe-hydrogenase nickel incorporation protein [Vibrio halioticoli NBRC 102217]|uniref:Hydrogenase maturation factor HypA n=2 Tax=Vibrionaceae TaxID=641 RepID=V5HK23_9VIBR|nr:hydrogenase maturation nickel metallochaperone HypA [Vibrio sp. B1Z05]GAD89610.1 putative NiFe-hydrogenase nickel incorporation protein [Vibrio halioticoli NBRC 102217]